MKSRVLLDIMLIFALYVLYMLVMLIAAQITGVELGDVVASPSGPVFGVSLLCSLVWYALGEWVLRSYTSTATWYGLWFLLLVLILITSGATVFVPSLRTIGPELNMPTLLCGPVFYYLATMLFSPFHAQFLIWPSKYVRKW